MKEDVLRRKRQSSENNLRLDLDLTDLKIRSKGLKTKCLQSIRLFFISVCVDHIDELNSGGYTTSDKCLQTIEASSRLTEKFRIKFCRCIFWY